MKCALEQAGGKTVSLHGSSAVIRKKRETEVGPRAAAFMEHWHSMKAAARFHRQKQKEEECLGLFDHIRYDLNSIKKRDPAARNSLEVLLLYSGFHAVFWYRLSHWFFKYKCFFLARLVSQLTRFFTGIEIHPGAEIGRGLMIDHGSGVVIGETTVIGDDCTVYQGVTLGGTGKEIGKRHPTLGNNVIVGSGAKVLGPFKVGDNSKIASNAVVLSAIPENSTAVGVPARVVRRNGKKVESDMDQIHIPDPLSQELCQMRQQMKRLERRMAELENENTRLQEEIG